MNLLLVRHADAGDRAAWTGDDRQRPLSATGRGQAAGLVELHRGRHLDRILSSPARRCLDTVEPIANDRGLHVEEADALAEGAPLDRTDRLLRRLTGTDTLVCSHADVLAGILMTLHSRGVLKDLPEWKKASTWVLDAWPDPERAELLPAPPVGG